MTGLARCCHAEAFFVPHSTMTTWVKNAENVFLMDDIPEPERKAVARQVADKIIAGLANNQELSQ